MPQTLAKRFLAVLILALGLRQVRRGEAACERKSYEMTIHDNPDYRPATVRAYACVEVRRHNLISNVTYDGHDVGFIKIPAEDDCCCQVQNSMIKKKKLRTVRPNIADAWITYRRILSCQCVPCV